MYFPLGVVAPCVAIVVANLACDRPTPDESRVSAKFGWDSGDYHQGMGLLQAAEAKGDLTPAQWDEAQRLADDKSWGVSHNALAAMMHLRNSPLREQAIAIATRKLQAQDPETRGTALIVLYHLRAPDWKAKVDEALHSPDEFVRSSAQGILDRDAHGPAAHKPAVYK